MLRIPFCLRYAAAALNGVPRSEPVRIEQIVRSETEKVASQAKAAAKQADRPAAARG